MIYYAIKIDNKYFKDYKYADKNTSGRHGGNTYLGSITGEDDIIGVTTTDDIKRTETRRSLGNTISVLYDIDTMKNKKIEIIPVEE